MQPLTSNLWDDLKIYFTIYSALCFAIVRDTIIGQNVNAIQRICVLAVSVIIYANFKQKTLLNYGCLYHKVRTPKYTCKKKPE